MRPAPGWHGYWLNPGDAGLPMDVKWQLPTGFSAGPLRYPVPTRLDDRRTDELRLRARLCRARAAEGAGECAWHRADPRRRALARLHRQDLRARAGRTLARSSGRQRNAEPRAVRRVAASACRSRLRASAISRRAGDKLRVAIPLPASVEVEKPYLFPMTDGAVDYEAPAGLPPVGDIARSPSCKRKGPVPAEFAGVLALGDGRGLEFHAVPGPVPEAERRLAALVRSAILWAVLGAIAGGILLNLMPCVFPILALKALASCRARRRARARRAAMRLPTRRCDRRHRRARRCAARSSAPAGAEAGWAFQLQDPRTIMLLLLLAVGDHRQPARPVRASGARRRCAAGRQLRRPGALAAFVATPCAGPFLGAALGTALLLPAAGSVAGVRRARAWPRAAVPAARVRSGACRDRLPKPGRWMDRLKRFLAIPMAASAVAGLWLLYRQAGDRALVIRAVRRSGARCSASYFAGRHAAPRHGAPGTLRALALAASSAIAAVAVVPVGNRAHSIDSRGAEPWSEARVASYVAAGQARLRLFHRRLVPELQGQRSGVDRPRRGPRRLQARPA